MYFSLCAVMHNVLSLFECLLRRYIIMNRTDKNPFNACLWCVRPVCECVFVSPIRSGFSSVADFTEALATAGREQSCWEVLRWRECWETEVIIWGQAALAKSAWTAAPCQRAISIPHSLQPHTLTAHWRDRYTLHTSHRGCLSRANPSMLGGCVSGAHTIHSCILRAHRLLCVRACAGPCMHI